MGLLGCLFIRCPKNMSGEKRAGGCVLMVFRIPLCQRPAVCSMCGLELTFNVTKNAADSYER